ncbi:flippase-like domain-containing protein [Patescibacteria group bacterium]|nr:flippase-like domain-containing protein [Patescibacteria group bacterium]
MKKYLIFAFKVFVSVFLVYFIFTKISFGDILGVLKEANLGYFFAAVFLALLALYINTFKWKLWLEYFSIHENVYPLFILNLASVFYSIFLPGGVLAGDAVRVYKSFDLHEEKKKIATSIFLDRAIGLSVSVFVGFTGLILTDSAVRDYGFVFNIYLLFFVGALFFLGFLIWFYKNYRVVFLSSFYAVCSHVLYAFLVYILSLSIGLEISFFDILWPLALANFILVVPVSFFGLGVREVSFIYILGMIGITAVSATSLSLLIFFSTLIIGFIGGAVEFYFWAKKKMWLAASSDLENGIIKKSSALSGEKISMNKESQKE